MNNPITNPFVHSTAATRYAASRPYFQPLVAEQIVTFTGTRHFRHVLDVGCGTGQTARALAEIANHVTAVDISPEMLAVAEPHERVTFLLARAEQLPFGEQTFDLATVGLAFHWFDQPAFLREAHRVLKPRTWLVIFNSGFTGRMSENEQFHDWATNDYLRQFPKPARGASGVSNELAESLGFALKPTISFPHFAQMSVEGLANYLSTQSNVIERVEGGTMSIAETQAWISNGAAPYFEGETLRTFEFLSTVWYLQRE